MSYTSKNLFSLSLKFNSFIDFKFRVGYSFVNTWVLINFTTVPPYRLSNNRVSHSALPNNLVKVFTILQVTNFNVCKDKAGYLAIFTR